MDGSIADYIRANRGQYTREAITQQLIQAGHERAAVDAAWEQLAAREPVAGSQGTKLATYVWIVYWLGAGIILAITLISIVGSGGGAGFAVFGFGWLVAYLALAYLPARGIAAVRPTGIGALAVIIAAPLLVLLVGGGICLGTIAIIAGSFNR